MEEQMKEAGILIQNMQKQAFNKCLESYEVTTATLEKISIYLYWDRSIEGFMNRWKYLKTSCRASG
jgi:hypothetical protein